MNEFRVNVNPCIGSLIGSWHSETVGSYELANSILESVANYTLYLHEKDLMEDYSNCMIIEQKVDGGWIAFD